MIKKFATAWEKNHEALEQHFKTTPQDGYPDDPTLCALLFYVVINPYLVERGEEEYDVFNMRIIDDGYESGCSIMMICKEKPEGVAPEIGDYIITHCDYNIHEVHHGTGMPSMEQVEFYMGFCKELMQRATYIKGSAPKQD